jgi:hypothetical protein
MQPDVAQVVRALGVGQLLRLHLQGGMGAGSKLFGALRTGCG